MTEEKQFKIFKNRKVLITGGLGFIGSNLAIKLVRLGADVTIIDSLIPEYGGNLFNIDGIKDKVKVNISDIRDENGIQYLVKGQEYIFNLAGQVSHLDSMKDPHADLEINCRSQLSLLEACRKHNPSVKIVFAGSRQQYGKPLYLPVDETHLIQPVDVNGINKAAGEWYHILYNNVYKIKSSSLRLTNSFGPGQLMKHNRHGFVYWFIRQAIDGKEIKIFGDGSQVRDFVYIDDIVCALLMVAVSDEVNGQVFNLGGQRPYSLKSFVEILLSICKSSSYSLSPFPPEKKRIDIGDYYADYSKIKKMLYWEPKVSLKEGLKKTVKYYMKHKEHYW